MIRTKRWNDAREPDDGFRVLVCRYRPRALPKKDETWDVWWKELGPSKELHHDYYHSDLAWEEYRTRWLAEMEDAWWRIADLVRRHNAGETITLLCSSACTDETRCHRTLLKTVIEAGKL